MRLLSIACLEEECIQDQAEIIILCHQPPKNEGIDDVTGEPLIQREDDLPETVKASTRCLSRRD